ncbi:18974_t:CDS:2, partial [Racocetra persica]
MASAEDQPLINSSQEKLLTNTSPKPYELIKIAPELCELTNTTPKPCEFINTALKTSENTNLNKKQKCTDSGEIFYHSNLISSASLVRNIDKIKFTTWFDFLADFQSGYNLSRVNELTRVHTIRMPSRVNGPNY